MAAGVSAPRPSTAAAAARALHPNCPLGAGLRARDPRGQPHVAERSARAPRAHGPVAPQRRRHLAAPPHLRASGSARCTYGSLRAKRRREGLERATQRRLGRKCKVPWEEGPDRESRREATDRTRGVNQVGKGEEPQSNLSKVVKQARIAKLATRSDPLSCEGSYVLAPQSLSLLPLGEPGEHARA